MCYLTIAAHVKSSNSNKGSKYLILFIIEEGVANICI